jgi:hypothetical protein
MKKNTGARWEREHVHIPDCPCSNAAAIAWANIGIGYRHFCDGDHIPLALFRRLEAWRRIQIRQLFRLSLEASFYRVVLQLEDGPRSTETLVGAFLDQAARPERGAASEWLNAPGIVGNGPTALMDRIAQALDDPSQAKLASIIADGLSFCIAEAPEYGQLFERTDRLPLFRARREAEAWGKAPTRSFVRHVLESWVLAQHAYWAAISRF